MDGTQILAAILLVAMLAFLLPRAKQMLKNSPKAESGDWQSVLLPVGMVVLFVIFLISVV